MDEERYFDEEQKLSKTTDIMERNKILLKRYRREQRREFINDLPLWGLGILFLILCAISLGILEWNLQWQICSF